MKVIIKDKNKEIYGIVEVDIFRLDGLENFINDFKKNNPDDYDLEDLVDKLDELNFDFEFASFIYYI